MELKIKQVEPCGAIEKRPVMGTKRIVWVQKCRMTLEDGTTHPCDVTAGKKKSLEANRLSMVQRGWHDPGSHMITMRYGL